MPNGIAVCSPVSAPSRLESSCGSEDTARADRPGRSGCRADSGVSLAVHTPWARNRALTFARDFVERYNLVLEAGSLGYNALTRRITLTDVRLAAKGHEQRPFLVASRIEVQLPWTVYRRRFAIDHLEITKGVVDIYRDENNVTNLPPGSNRPTPEQPRRLDIRGLTLRGLDVHYTDAARNWGLKVPGIESDLTNTALGAKGDFAVRGEMSFRLRERTMTMAPFETVMTFDGSNVLIEEARLSSSEIDAFIAGPIARVLDSPSLDLTLKGSRESRQGDAVGAAAARAGVGHGDDRRHHQGAGAQLRHRSESRQQHARRGTRETSRALRSCARDLRGVLRT